MGVDGERHARGCRGARGRAGDDRPVIVVAVFLVCLFARDDASWGASVCVETDVSRSCHAKP